MTHKQHEAAAVLWRDRLARFERSNLTVRQFCREEGVSAGSFYQWRLRIRKEQADGSKPMAHCDRKASTVPKPFVPVSVSCSVAEIEFPNGVRIRVPATDTEALRTVLTTGETWCREVR